MKVISNALAIIILFSFLCFGCFFDNEITQYICHKNNKELEPVTKVVYKVSVDRQEVIYWSEPPGQERSPLFKLAKCIVVDKNTSEGEQDSSPSGRIEYVDGEFHSTNQELLNVSWWTWHFKTDPKPSNLAFISGLVMAVLMAIGMVSAIVEEIGKWRKNKKDKTNQVDIFKELS